MLQGLLEVLGLHSAAMRQQGTLSCEELWTAAGHLEDQVEQTKQTGKLFIEVSKLTEIAMVEDTTLKLRAKIGFR